MVPAASKIAVDTLNQAANCAQCRTVAILSTIDMHLSIRTRKHAGKETCDLNEARNHCNDAADGTKCGDPFARAIGFIRILCLLFRARQS